MPTPPRNPYIAGKALNDARGFFGREDVFRLVETVLSSPDQNSVVLFGQRRIGKTSILLNLHSRLPSPPFVSVYFDLMDRARKSLAEVLYELAATIAQELNLPQPAPSDFDDGGRGFREKFLPTVYAALGEYKRLVLLFDEFDVLDVAQDQQLPTNAAARVFFPYLREWMTKEPRIGFVFVVGRKADDLSIDVKATFKAARYQRVSVLGEEATKELVLLAERDRTLRFSDDAVTRIFALTAGHPFFTQLLCQLLFERAYQTTANDVPTVITANVDAVVQKTLEAAENVFEWIWDGLPPAERVIFSAVAAGTDEQTVVTEERLMSILQSQGIRILIRELELAPKTLVEWEMLKQTNGGYKFFVELMRRWIVERKPLPKVKDELDRIVPLADMLYQAANSFYRRADLERASTQLQSALNVNPNHLKARLLLGDIYRGQSKWDDAVSELEVAYRIDVDAARILLESVLLQRAAFLERQNKTDDAITDYTRVLKISPNNKTAEEHYSEIWLKRGEAALKANDLDSAKKAFQEAGVKNLVAEVEATQNKIRIEQQAKTAETLMTGEKWEEAIAAYQQLLILDKGDQRWQDGLVKAEQGLEIVRKYREGLGAIQQGKWTEAQRAFADVVYFSPQYKDAAKLLARATAHLRDEKGPEEQMQQQLEQQLKQQAEIKQRMSELEQEYALLQQQEEERDRKLAKVIRDTTTVVRMLLAVPIHIGVYFGVGFAASKLVEWFISIFQPFMLNSVSSVALFTYLGIGSAILLIQLDAPSYSTRTDSSLVYDRLEGFLNTLRGWASLNPSRDRSREKSFILENGSEWVAWHARGALFLSVFAVLGMGISAGLGLTTSWLFETDFGFYFGYMLLICCMVVLIIYTGISNLMKFFE